MLEPPEIDLCFAISATVVDSNDTFTLMKETINEVLENYGVGKIRYSVIVFGSQTRLELRFDSGITDPARLEAIFKSLGPQGGDPALDKALKMALEAFNGSLTRPNARKVLVVMTDNVSAELDQDQIRALVSTLSKTYVRVIAVAVGDKADGGRLKHAATDSRDVVSVPASTTPTKLFKQVMELVLTGILT